MLACKNALRCRRRLRSAVEALRIKGAKDVGKRAERATAEGLVAAGTVRLIELNSRPTSSPRTPSSSSWPIRSWGGAGVKAADVDALKAAKVGDKTVEETIAELSAKIGEKLELRRVQYRRQRRDLPAQAGRRPPPAVGCWWSSRGADNDAGTPVALQIAALEGQST